MKLQSVAAANALANHLIELRSASESAKHLDPDDRSVVHFVYLVYGRREDSSFSIDNSTFRAVLATEITNTEKALADMGVQL